MQVVFRIYCNTFSDILFTAPVFEHKRSMAPVVYRAMRTRDSYLDNHWRLSPTKSNTLDRNRMKDNA